MSTATASPASVSAPAPMLNVRMPVHLLPARAVSLFGIFIKGFTAGGDPLDLDRAETVYADLLEQRARDERCNVNELVAAYLTTVGMSITPHRSLTVNLDGGRSEFVLKRNGCTVMLVITRNERGPSKLTLHLEGPAKRLESIATADADLGRVANEKLWSTDCGPQSGTFVAAFRYWFNQSVDFEAKQKLG